MSASCFARSLDLAPQLLSHKLDQYLRHGPRSASTETDNHRCGYRKNSLRLEPQGSTDGYNNFGRHVHIAFDLKDAAKLSDCKVVQWLRGCIYNLRFQDYILRGWTLYGEDDSYGTTLGRWIIDSLDKDPSYQIYAVANGGYINDYPQISGRSNIQGAKMDLEFRTCVYNKESVPKKVEVIRAKVLSRSGRHSQPRTRAIKFGYIKAKPIDCLDWQVEGTYHRGEAYYENENKEEEAAYRMPTVSLQ